MYGLSPHNEIQNAKKGQGFTNGILRYTTIFFFIISK